jgi:hypothetical protein
MPDLPMVIVLQGSLSFELEGSNSPPLSLAEFRIELPAEGESPPRLTVDGKFIEADTDALDKIVTAVLEASAQS